MLDFQRYFMETITSVRDIHHRGNNRLFEIIFPERSYLLKQYSPRHMEDWKRGKTEFSAISYLWARGFRSIPQHVSFHEEDNIAIYSYEPGKTIDSGEVNKEHISCAVDFLAALHNLGDEDKSQFKPASSACICLQDYSQVLDRRFNNVSQFTPDNTLLRRAREFLDEEVYPTMQELKTRLAMEKGTGVKLSLDSQVLTPADFGFHNILFSNRDYKIVDFEYFGRDDPVRQVLDFLHHDKSLGIKRELKDLFLEQYREKARPRQGFEERLKIADPLVGMAWVFIYLNVLSKDYLEHLKFSQGNSDVVEDRLKKAQIKINTLRYFENAS